MSSCTQGVGRRCNPLNLRQGEKIPHRAVEVFPKAEGLGGCTQFTPEKAEIDTGWSWTPIRWESILTVLEPEPGECCCLGTHISPRQGTYECSLEKPWALRQNLRFCPIEPPGGAWRCTTVCLGAEEGVKSDNQNREIREATFRDKRIVGERETVRKL